MVSLTSTLMEITLAWKILDDFLPWKEVEKNESVTTLQFQQEISKD